MHPTVLVSTWADGVFVFGDGRTQELAGQAIHALAPDGRSGALAIVGGREVRRRDAGGVWHMLASTDADLACCVAVDDFVYLGTNDARVLRLEPSGALVPLTHLDTTAGREAWYAGQAVVDGRVVGPPLGVRSITATCDGRVLLANVHVGGIPRSTDGGKTWHPTIAVQSDVHEVRAHPERPELVVAASAAGLCISRDAGATWTIDQQGLHAPHSTSVAFLGDDVLLGASEEQFSPAGAVYRRALDGAVPLARLRGGMPEWLDGIADTRCIGANGAAGAVADGRGNVYLTTDAGGSWSRVATGVPGPSSVVVT